MVSDEGEGDELLIIIATLATAEVSARALAKADQHRIRIVSTIYMEGGGHKNKTKKTNKSEITESKIKLEIKIKIKIN